MFPIEQAKLHKCGHSLCMVTLTDNHLLINHAAALATIPGMWGIKKKLPKKGTVGGPEKTNTRLVQSNLTMYHLTILEAMKQ